MKIDFDLFMIVWNNLQSMGTPSVHIKIARWLSQSYENKDNELLLMAFRSCGKSTIVGLFCAWLLYRDPNLRIMVLSAEQTLAKKMVQNVKRIIEKHPFTKGLKPSKKEEWSSSSFTVNRDLALRDPSVIARGLNGNITGSRADFIICDDVEVPNTCDTSGKRESLREKLAELDYILTPNGFQLYVGTPHNFYTIYAKEIRKEIGEERTFLSGFKRLEVPVIDDKGKSAWEDKYPLYAMDKVRLKTGANKFDSQMLLKPTNIAEGRLDPEDLKVYDAELEYNEANGREVLSLMGDRLSGVSCCWDPAFGNGGDGSVIACVFTDSKGEYYLHGIRYIRIDTNSSEDEATQQCKIVKQFADEYFLPSVEVETNGIGKFLPSLLRKELSGSSTSVLEHTSTRNKEMRILEAFDAVLAGGALNVHKRVLSTAFATELREWNPDKNYKGHDDGLDAVARSINSQPIRIGSYGVSKGRSWQGGGETMKAETDFEV
jgi:hypothetical protein